MEKVSLRFIILIPALFFFSIFTKETHCSSSSSSIGEVEIERWFRQLPHKQQKHTRLRFYFHDRGTGPNRTVVEVARSNLTDTFSSQFGLFYVADDLLTEGPDPGSNELGRAQGISGMADQKEGAQVMGFNFVFTVGPHKGSSLAVFSRNPIWHAERELAVVGGTGDFRLARGVAGLKTTMVNFTTQSVTVEYDVFIVHY